MKLLIFDIDGTLSNSLELDDNCFREAFYDLFSFRVQDEIWFNIKKAASGTDSGILLQMFRYHLNRKPSNDELKLFKRHFLSKLEHEIAKNPEIISEIPGAKDFLRLLNESKFYVAIATGCWIESARIKLNAIGIDPDTYPLSTSDKSDLRSNIIRYAIDLSYDFYKTSEFDNIIYYGDELWDYFAAIDNKIDFAGIDYKSTNKLSDYGIKTVFHDFDSLKQTFYTD